MLIYVLEDSPTQLIAMVAALGEAGHVVQGFADLPSIQRAFEQVQPDAIVADLHLRDGRTWGTSAPLLGQGVPVIVATQDFDEEMRRALMMAGAVAVVDKMRSGDVVAAVARIF